MTISVSGPKKDVIDQQEGPLHLSSWNLTYQGIDALSLELYTPMHDPQYFGMAWPTNLPTQQGLHAIRQSYERLKRTYREPRKLPEMSWIDLIAFRRKRGPVEFHMEGHDDPTAVSLNVFLDPNSFHAKSGDENPLSWIRVNTEYADYWFDGQSYPGVRRNAGLMGLENMSEEIMRFYKATSSITLPDKHLVEVNHTLDELLEGLPRLITR